MYRYIPSLLTLSRLVAVFTLIPIYAHRAGLVFLIVASLAALTDRLDGQLARRWKCETEGGAVLDIMADKSFCGVMLALGFLRWNGSKCFMIPLLMLATYHVFVLLLRAVGVATFKSSFVAKVKMFIEMTSLIVVFSSFGLHWKVFAYADDIGLAGMWLAGSLAIWSIAHYSRPDIVPDLTWPRFRSPQQARAAPH